ncbi:zinc finger protein 564-like [Aricia agestis]|uniref:zinc finger protein 564-like n=1 Tax=Aricia agestis TaxID=91739 RepID=UPI001C205357|nr:zinc finger protein 564-like [Aricia agestis]XP_041969442.1 zinc finger protein 564-like [Aricia agestis]
MSLLVRKRRGRPPGSKNKIKPSIKEEKDDGWYCRTCKSSFKTASELRAHKGECKQWMIELRLKSKPKYYCDKCPKKFKVKTCFENHLLNEHSETPGSVPCEQCNVVCPNIEVLTAHIANIHERSIFECEFCEKKFVRQAHVIRHMSQTGCDGKGKQLYPCEICSKTFSRKDNLMVHLRLNHISKKSFNCKHCNFSTNNFSKLILHNQHRHTEVPHFECHHCGKVTGSRAAISKHLEIHGDKKYKCDVCGHNTFTIEVMRRHVLTHIPNKPHKCQICGNSYIQKLQLDRHMLKHIGFACRKCDKMFDAKSKLLAHDRNHVRNGPILCPFEDCEYTKKELEDMEAYEDHIKDHNMVDKTYECTVCNKMFNCESFLRRHVGTHALERARRCMYCVTARAYARGEQLVRHVRNKHPDVFRARLQHVRTVLGSTVTGTRVTKSEMESVLNVLDAETDRILEDYGPGVLYGGLQEEAEDADEEVEVQEKKEKSPLMSETELEEHLRRLLSQLIEIDVLEYFGWPDESVDTVLEKVIENMGARVAPRDKWSRVQRLRENTKHLFLHAVEDAAIARMLDTHTIDQVVKHILEKVTTNVKTEDESPKNDEDVKHAKMEVD